MHKKVVKLIQHFQFDKIPVEGTLYKSTYVSKQQVSGVPNGTAMIGMYCHEPQSHSTFHRLSRDEVWHHYKGDAFILHLIYPNGHYQKVLMGKKIYKGEKIQFVVPANTWQAGELTAKGNYAVFGCTLAPGFTGECFKGGSMDLLLSEFPEHAKIIKKLSVKQGDLNLPNGYQQ